MSKKIVIVSGGELEESFVLSELETLDSQFIIGVDKGMEFLYHHKILPSYIVGDFDSVDQKIGDYYRNETKVPIREFNPVKDASDTEIAIRLAMTLGASEIYISERPVEESTICGQMYRHSQFHLKRELMRSFWIPKIRFA